MIKNNFSVYRVRDQVFVPALYMSQVGFFSKDPVAVHPITDEQGIVDSIVAELRLDRGSITLPKSRTDYPKPAVVVSAGLKSWSMLEKHGRVWWAELVGGQWHIHTPRTNAKGKWEADPNADETLSGDIPLEQLARRIVELVKAQPAN